MLKRTPGMEDSMGFGLVKFPIFSTAHIASAGLSREVAGGGLMRSCAYIPFMEQHRLCIKLGSHGNNITQQRLDGGWTNQIVQLPQSSTSAI
jgi:hypothetical protein